MKAEVVAKASAAQKEIATEPQKPRDPQHIAAKRIESAAGGIPPLRFGTINDSLPAAPDTIRIPGSRASGWTTVHAPLANMYAGQLPWLSRDLLQFPIANSDGTIVMSILPVVSTVTLLTAMNGAEKGKLYEHPQMEYYKLEAVWDRQTLSSRNWLMPRLVTVPHNTRKAVFPISSVQ
ncbi:sphinganine kinase lcb4 [Cystobasidiomycetes sp. EMM_F5]